MAESVYVPIQSNYFVALTKARLNPGTSIPPGGRRLKAKTAILAILCLAILVAGGRVLDWSVLRIGKAPVSRIKWRQTLPEALTSPPALGSDESIYVSTRGGSVYGLDRSGVVQWAYRPGLEEMPAGLLLDQQDNLYFSTQKRVLSLTASGKKRWETPCTPPRASQEMQAGALGEGMLFTTCGESFAALDTTDGRELWKLPVYQWNPFPVVLKSGAIVLVHDWSLAAIDRNGNSLWHFPPPGYIAPRPRPGLTVDQMFFPSPIAVGSDDSLYVGSGDGEFSCFSAEGALNWTYNAGPLHGVSFLASPVITFDGTVIAISTEASVYAFTGAGEVLWRLHIGPPVRNNIQPSPVLGSDGAIYVLAAGKLVALSARGTKLWELPLPSDAVTSPTLAPDGTLYVATNDKTLYTVQTSSRGLMKSAWPKYQRDPSNSGSSF